jgi:8-oxo-dGTP pyrophosphatase MutT (NUDIX family)
MSRARLPGSIAEWRTVLKQALELPSKAIRVPSQFCIVSGSNGDFMRSFGPAFSSAGKPPPKLSATLTALMPLSGASPSAAEALALARQASGHGAFAPAGQPAWPGVTAESTAAGAALLGVTNLEYDGMDLVVPVTMRTGKLRAHSKQMSLPGGRCDPGETIVDAALREAREEIGLDTSRLEMLGETSRLYSFPSKAFVHPCVALSDRFLDCHVASADEVTSIHYLSLGALLCDARFHHRITKEWTETGPVRMPGYYTTDGQLVWGLTAFAIGELVSRVATVLRIEPRVPDEVLRAWGEERLVGVQHVKFFNPYEEALLSVSRPIVDNNGAVEADNEAMTAAAAAIDPPRAKL